MQFTKILRAVGNINKIVIKKGRKLLYWVFGIQQYIKGGSKSKIIELPLIQQYIRRRRKY